jgi:hypothetical protein
MSDEVSNLLNEVESRLSHGNTGQSYHNSEGQSVEGYPKMISSSGLNGNTGYKPKIRDAMSDSMLDPGLMNAYLNQANASGEENSGGKSFNKKIGDKFPGFVNLGASQEDGVFRKIEAEKKERVENKAEKYMNKSDTEQRVFDPPSEKKPMVRRSYYGDYEPREYRDSYRVDDYYPRKVHKEHEEHDNDVAVQSNRKKLARKSYFIFVAGRRKIKINKKIFFSLLAVTLYLIYLDYQNNPL